MDMGDKYNCHNAKSAILLNYELLHKQVARPRSDDPIQNVYFIQARPMTSLKARTLTVFGSV